MNSISAYNYIQISLLRTYISTHKFDVICISKTYLDSDTSDDDDNLKIAGYNLIRVDRPSNTKRDGVCIYYKHHFYYYSGDHQNWSNGECIDSHYSNKKRAAETQDSEKREVGSQHRNRGSYVHTTSQSRQVWFPR